MCNMKKFSIFRLAAAVALATGFASCADLGFGVDVDSSGPMPYFYGSTVPGYGDWGPWYGDPAWTWWPAGGYNPGPIYNPGYNPGPVIPPRPSRPSAPSLPGFRPPSSVNTGPSINGLPTTILGTERPGNLGRPTQPQQPEKPIQPRGR